MGVNPEKILTPLYIPWRRVGTGFLLAIAAAFLFFRMGSSARAVNRGLPKGPRASREYVLEPLTANEKKVWLVEHKADPLHRAVQQDQGRAVRKRDSRISFLGTRSHRCAPGL